MIYYLRSFCVYKVLDGENFNARVVHSSICSKLIKHFKAICISVFDSNAIATASAT